MLKQCLGPTCHGHSNEVVLVQRWLLCEVLLYKH